MVAYGDSAFDGAAVAELSPEVPCFAFWRGQNEEVPRAMGHPMGHPHHGERMMDCLRSDGSDDIDEAGDG